MKDPYRVLGVPSRSDASVIKAAYYALLKKYHPDKAGDDPVAAEKFREVRAAWEYLDEQDRQRPPLDATGSQHQARDGNAPIRSVFNPSTPAGAKSDADAGHRDEQSSDVSIFDSFRYLAETLLLCAIAAIVGLLVLIFLG